MERNLKNEKVEITEKNNLKKKKAHSEAKKLYKINPLNNLEEISKLQIISNQNRLGIFCLSANCSSILSWSHYSDSHRGFCIGFDTSVLFDFSIDMKKILL